MGNKKELQKIILDDLERQKQILRTSSLSFGKQLQPRNLSSPQSSPFGTTNYTPTVNISTLFSGSPTNVKQKPKSSPNGDSSLFSPKALGMHTKNKQKSTEKKTSAKCLKYEDVNSKPTMQIQNQESLKEGQHWAMEEANRTSMGYYIEQNSSFGNLILPVIPRL